MKKNSHDNSIFSKSYLSRMQRKPKTNIEETNEITFKATFNKHDFLQLPKNVQEFLRGKEIKSGDEVQLTFFNRD